MEDFKNPLKSKTVIFGLLQITVAICALLLADGWIQTHPRAVTAIGLVSGIATIVLRFLTTAPIAWPSEPASPERLYREIPANTELRAGDQRARLESKHDDGSDCHHQLSESARPGRLSLVDALCLPASLGTNRARELGTAHFEFVEAMGPIWSRGSARK